MRGKFSKCFLAYSLHLGDVDDDALRGPRKSHVRIEEQRKVLRRESRLTALRKWESSSRGTAVNKAVSKVQARMKGIVVRKQMRPLLRGPAPGAANDGLGGGHKRPCPASPASTDVTSGADSMVLKSNMDGPPLLGHQEVAAHCAVMCHSGGECARAVGCATVDGNDDTTGGSGWTAEPT